MTKRSRQIRILPLKIPRDAARTETAPKTPWPRWITWCFSCDKRVGWRGEGIGDDHKQFCEECDGRVYGFWRDHPEGHPLHATDTFLKDRAKAEAPKP